MLFVIQLKRAANGPELYRYVMQSVGALQQAVYSKAFKANPKARAQAWGADSSSEGTAVTSESTCPHQSDALLEEVSDAMASVWGNSNQFEPLEDAVNR